MTTNSEKLQAAIDTNTAAVKAVAPCVISAATDISELCELLNMAEDYVRETNREMRNEMPVDGESYDELSINDLVDLCTLPSFGGEVPVDTFNVWSFDAESVLRWNDGSRSYRVYDRE